MTRLAAEVDMLRMFIRLAVDIKVLQWKIFPRAENRISTQPPLSRDGLVLLTLPGEGILLVGIGRY